MAGNLKGAIDEYEYLLKKANETGCKVNYVNLYKIWVISLLRKICLDVRMSIF